MKEKIKKIIYQLNYSFLLKNYILLESNPDFSDNTRAVFDKMIEIKLNEKYKLIWLVDDSKKFKDIKIKNVKFITRKMNIANIYYRLFSKYILDCNKIISKYNKYQFRMFLSHGEFIKLPQKYINQIGEYDKFVHLSKFFSDVVYEKFKLDKRKSIITGYPRNDVLLKKSDNIKKIVCGNSKIEKIIIWMPTFRNHKNGSNNENITNIKYKYGVPLIKNKDQLEILNNKLLKQNNLLIIKLHPAENISKMKISNYSNIMFINDNKIFENHNLSFYNLLSVTDALITDYSSVYYDYLLLDKPIAIAAPDIKEYSSHVELVFNNYEENIIGEYINNFEQLLCFIDNVTNNIDVKYSERKKVREKYHEYTDNNSTERVLKILLEKMKERD